MKKPYYLINSKSPQKDTPAWPTDEIYNSLEEAERQFSTQKIKFQKFARDLLDFLPLSSGKLLDVGCGLGWVVAEANKRGFAAIGIDQAKPFVVTGERRLKVDLRVSDLEHFQTTENSM